MPINPSRTTRVSHGRGHVSLQSSVEVAVVDVEVHGEPTPTLALREVGDGQNRNTRI
jgi:hypothetical protein